jgi:peptidoglycan hydrolase-like protein with peptidoglycan-binding domain
MAGSVMQRTWIGCAQGNFRKGRQTFHPEAIVLHSLPGSLDDARVRFLDPQSATSAHYAVGHSGEIHQYVDEADTAFHCGVVVQPTWSLLKKAVNPNFHTLGVEHESVPSQEATDEQNQASGRLIAELACRWNIRIDADHIVLHSEIRASSRCPAPHLDRAVLLRYAQVAAARAPATFVTGAPTELQIISTANLREAVPSSAARIVRVLPAGTKVRSTGFTAHGQQVNGNASWYQLEDGNFLWAGATSVPRPADAGEPRPLVPKAPAPPQKPLKSGISRLDDLLASAGASALQPGDPDKAAVGAIQDLLIGHGFSHLPSIFDVSYGEFTQATRTAISSFQAQGGLTPTGIVDDRTIKALVTTHAIDPRLTQVYTTVVLGVPFDSLCRILSITAHVEGAGRFAALNRNTDRAGLSFGLIQWAQRPGRLAEILAAFAQSQRDQFTQLFGEGNARRGEALLDLLRKPAGGVDPHTGATLDQTFDLINEPWLSRFRQAGLQPAFQRQQVQLARTAFQKSYERLSVYAPALSERAVACMLDIANQFGDGGLEALYRSVHRPGIDEHLLLTALANASVEKIAAPLRVSVRARRTLLLETSLLSDSAFHIT